MATSWQVETTVCSKNSNLKKYSNFFETGCNGVIIKKRLATYVLRYILSLIDKNIVRYTYESFSDLGEIRVWLRADFQSGSRVLKKVF